MPQEIETDAQTGAVHTDLTHLARFHKRDDFRGTRLADAEQDRIGFNGRVPIPVLTEDDFSPAGCVGSSGQGRAFFGRRHQLRSGVNEQNAGQLAAGPFGDPLHLQEELRGVGLDLWQKGHRSLKGRPGIDPCYAGNQPQIGIRVVVDGIGNAGTIAAPALVGFTLELD